MTEVQILLLLLLALAASLVGWLCWLALVSWWFRIRSEPPQVLRVRAADGWRLAVHHRPARERRFAEPVVLAHGLAANRHTFEFDPPYSLAHALSEAGFDCYTVEWRGTGMSSWPPRRRRWWDYSIDDHIRLDAPAVVELVKQRSGAQRVLWVGHSLGGLIGYAAAQGPLRDSLAALVAMGSPVSFGPDPVVRAAIRIGALAAWPFGLRQRLMSLSLAPWLGHVTLPLSDVIVNPQHIEPHIQRKVYARMISAMGRYVLSQLQDWVHHDRFRSLDGRTDYREGLRTLQVPLLVVGGTRDRLASPAAIALQYDLAGSPDKTKFLFGRDRGDAFDYGHGDLLFGTGAPAEVYPVLIRWLEEHATRVGGRQDEGRTGS